MKQYILPVVSFGILGSAGLLLYAQPALVAIACPSCMGFDHIGDAVHVERTMPVIQRDAAAAHIHRSNAAVETLFGSLTTHPMVLACAMKHHIPGS